MGPEQAIVAHELVRGELFIPVHWGTFNLAVHNWTEPVERALLAAERAGVAMSTPRPGESLEPGAASKGSRWWPDVPWKTATTTPVVSTGLSPSLRRRIRALGAPQISQADARRLGSRR